MTAEPRVDRIPNDAAVARPTDRRCRKSGIRPGGFGIETVERWRNNNMVRSIPPSVGTKLLRQLGLPKTSRRRRRVSAERSASERASSRRLTNWPRWLPILFGPSRTVVGFSETYTCVCVRLETAAVGLCRHCCRSVDVCWRVFLVTKVTFAFCTTQRSVIHCNRAADYHGIVIRRQ